MNLMLSEDPRDYRILSQSTCFEKDAHGTSADLDDFHSLKRALNSLGFSGEETDGVFRAVAAILHLGNLEFQELKSERAAIANEDVLSACSELLSVEKEALKKALLTKRIKAAMEEIDKFLSVSECRDNRDALCKALYNKLFEWSIRRINSTLHVSQDRYRTISLLDIFGFGKSVFFFTLVTN